MPKQPIDVVVTKLESYWWGVPLALLTAVLYSYSFHYEGGFLSYFSIPPDLIPNDITFFLRHERAVIVVLGIAVSAWFVAGKRWWTQLLVLIALFITPVVIEKHYTRASDGTFDPVDGMGMALRVGEALVAFALFIWYRKRIIAANRSGAVSNSADVFLTLPTQAQFLFAAILAVAVLDASVSAGRLRGWKAAEGDLMLLDRIALRHKADTTCTKKEGTETCVASTRAIGEDTLVAIRQYGTHMLLVSPSKDSCGRYSVYIMPSDDTTARFVPHRRLHMPAGRAGCKDPKVKAPKYWPI